MTLAVIAAYLALVLAVGLSGHRLFRGTGEDYFLASRTIGPFVLLMTLFGTNMTAFTILGASGEAYRAGIAVFALMGSSSAVVIPLVFYFVATRLWWLGRRQGYITQVQFFRDRYQSDRLGLLLFLVLTALLVPYVIIGIKGGGDALYTITGGASGGVPAWLGSLVICMVTFLYVAYGGMRSTAWANTLQTMVFLLVGAAAFFVILAQYGGLSGAMAALGASHPELLAIGPVRDNWARMLSFLLLPLSAGVFPHIFNHWLSARSARSFRFTLVAYPICITAIWVPSVVLGLVGRIDHPPPLDGPILVELIASHAGGLLAGLLAAGVFAAIMSSLDSQTLAVGTMFTQDIVRHYGFHDVLSDRQQVFFGRTFVALFLAVAFVLSLVTTRTIFNMGVWCLSGYAGLFPVVVAAAFWKRSTREGVIASILVVAGSWAYFFLQSLAAPGEYTIGGSGLLPVAVIFLLSVAALIGVSLATRPPSEAVLTRFYPASPAERLVRR